MSLVRDRPPPPSPPGQAWWLLLLATALWGVGFVAVARTLTVMDALWSNAWRFVLAAPVALWVFRARLVWDRGHLVASAWAGLCLTGAFLFQTWGLKTTSVAKSSLITGMYCVVTPLLAPLFRAPAPNRAHAAAAGLALLGLGMLTRVWEGLSGFSTGDALTLGCAVVSALHIHVVARVAPGRDAYALNALQLMWTAVFSLVLALVLDGGALALPKPAAWVPLGYLAVGSSVVAFGAQMRAQQQVGPATAATLLLLEAPFGVLSGVVFLDEPVGWWQVVGGALMVGGGAVAVRADTRVIPPA